MNRVDVEPERFEPASEDASFRCYFRATVNGVTSIVMDAPPHSQNNRSFLAVARMLGQAGLTAPHIEAADLELGLIQLEDLGSTCYLDVLNERTADALYGEALDALVTMQGRVDANNLPPYDRALLLRELSLFGEWFLGHHLGLELSTNDRRILDEAFELLCTACLEQPQVFVHRDYHSRNLMYREGHTGNPGIIDFQDAVRGPLTYDLVSLLRDVYIAWPADRVESWVREYRDKAVRAGLTHIQASVDAARGEVRQGIRPAHPIDESQLMRWLDLTGAQRHLKIAGLFCRLSHRDGKPRYLHDIPLALDYLTQTCAARPELNALGELLDRLQVRRAMDDSLDAMDSSA